MPITTKEVNYQNFGRCLFLSDGKTELLVTLDLGPRVIRYALCGGNNVFFEDLDRAFTAGNAEVQAAFGAGEKWFIYGGHRLWTSPESMPYSYYPDNTGVAYELTENGACFTPPAQRVNDVQMQVAVAFMDDGKVKVSHKVTVVGQSTREFAVWCISAMAPGGYSIIPQNRRDTGLLPNRTISVWPTANMGGDWLRFGEEYITLSHEPKLPRSFKMGLDLEAGKVCYINNGVAFVKRYEHQLSARYPDNGCSYETYFNNMFFECESLGPLAHVTPGESISHEETWELLPYEKEVDLRDATQVAQAFTEIVG